MQTRFSRIAHGLISLVAVLILAACGGGGDDTTPPPPGPFHLTFSLDASFHDDHGGQPISIALVRSSDSAVIANSSGIVSSTQNPSFSFATGAVMERGTTYEVHYWIDSNIGGGGPEVCDPILYDHQWSVEFLSVTNNINFTTSYQPWLTEYVCDTFN